MKSKTLLYILIVSLALVLILWKTSTVQNLQTDLVYDATINRDCAPWDGAAYTITIPNQVGSAIIVSIWKSPTLLSPITYSFPDSSGRVGTAIHQSALGSSQPLSGKITLQPFEAEGSVVGGFNFTSENGEQFNGNFKAKWGNEIALCG